MMSYVNKIPSNRYYIIIITISIQTDEHSHRNHMYLFVKVLIIKLNDKKMKWNEIKKNDPFYVPLADYYWLYSIAGLSHPLCLRYIFHFKGKKSNSHSNFSLFCGPFHLNSHANQSQSINVDILL